MEVQVERNGGKEGQMSGVQVRERRVGNKGVIETVSGSEDDC